MKHTKNEYRKLTKSMDKEGLKEELDNLNLQLFKGRFLGAQGTNPYEKGKFPMSLIKWKKAVISSLL